MSLLNFAPALAIGAAVSFVPLPGRRWIGLAVVAAGLAGAPWLAAALSSLSFPLIALAALRLLAPLTEIRVGRAPKIAVAVGGLAFYALVLAPGPFDPFGLGYAARPMLLGVAAAGLGLALLRETACLLLLAGALAAYALGVYANLWDALLDPLLVLVAIVSLPPFPGRRRLPA